MAEMVQPTRDPDLIAVKNGIFNYKTKQFSSFTPTLVFTTKTAVRYVNGAASPHIIMPDGLVWDFDSWMRSLSDNPEIVNLL